MNKTIYMTYKHSVPDKVFSRWKSINKDYNIDFNLDKDCINFLETSLNKKCSEIFKNINRGAHKADLWRIAKLYIDGGVYSDVDLVPYLNLNDLEKDITFYSCLSCDKKSIFQAFMLSSKPKSALLLAFIISYLNNYDEILKSWNGPTEDMAKCLKYNFDIDTLTPNKIYETNIIKIPINIGRSDNNIKHVDLIFFPEDINYKVELKKNDYKDSFGFEIKNNILIIKREDSNEGWEYNHNVDIIISSYERMLLFDEKGKYPKNFVIHKNKKILDSRDLEYHRNGSKW